MQVIDPQVGTLDKWPDLSSVILTRHIDILYLKPTFGWGLFNMSYSFVSPKVWGYLGKSALNEDVADWWGYLDLELTWRADFGVSFSR